MRPANERGGTGEGRRKAENGRAAVVVIALLALVIGVGLGVGASYYWFRWRPATVVVPIARASIAPSTFVPLVFSSPSPVPSASPSPFAAAPAQPLPDVSSPSPAPPAPPTESSPSARAKRRATASRKTVDSGEASATRPLPRPPATPPTPRPEPTPRGRRFVQGATSIESLKPIGADLRGFEADGVGVKRAPAVNGQVILEMDPPQPSAGKPYVVRVYLKNDGPRGIDVTGMKVSTVANGKTIQVPVTPEDKVVPARGRTLLRELPGTWKQSTDTWAMVVVVTSRRQDVYTNRLTWK